PLFCYRKQKIAMPQPWQAIAQRFCSIPVYRVVHHRAILPRTFKTEYQPPTGGTTEQEIRKTVSCFFFAPMPGERRFFSCNAHTLM
ncbi:hypothetical protein, partial [Enterocloster clostridioformis]|uniref:hypothetical protein n=1 Tax=Enterocloster clostridioformis TaxID=1531 RepID=UPI00321A8F4F